jgi:NADP-dependent aldehyde dehydrogenase
MSQTLIAATSPDNLEPVLAAAAASAEPYAALDPMKRAAGLCLIAARLKQNEDYLVAVAQKETGLSEGRLRGELDRTAVQLRLFAEVVVDGAYLDARIDKTDTEYALGVRPDLRRSLRPIGPVLNFAASNFPFAFSVAGGDSAAILAAGCPVIVKGHSGHDELSLITAKIVAEAVEASDFPAGTFTHITGQETGVAALRDSRVQAGSFTGSIAAGRLLADVAAARPQPIPFFGELGSVNPVVATRAAITERGETIANEFVASVAGSAGQLCTKPGFLFVPADHELDEHIAEAAEQIGPHRLLNPRIANSYERDLKTALSHPGMRVISAGTTERLDDHNARTTPTFAAISITDFIAAGDALHSEMFGPYSLLVEYADPHEVLEAITSCFEGNLTGTVHVGEAEYSGDASEAELALLRELTSLLSRMVGRVLFNSWPTGVAVTPAQQHGGPWPATTNDTSTSVGTAAISRFLRPVAYQNAPEYLLPPELQTTNPRNVSQSIDFPGSSLAWGKNISFPE